jgi:RNA polymerase sigma-70 factor (ECF subfamily)
VNTDAPEFEQYRQDVYRWAFRIVGRHHDALDVAQDVFLRWLRQHTTDPPGQPRPWLRRVTINRAIDLVRAREKGEPPLLLAKGEAPLFSIEQEEVRETLTAALAALTDSQRGVLVAKVFDGMTFAAIARELDIAVPTAKTHYLRALTSVRDELRKRKLP